MGATMRGLAGVAAGPRAARLLTAAAAVVVTACGSTSTPAVRPPSTPTPSPTPEAHRLTGRLTLHDADTAAAACVGQGGYSDIAEGADVVVKDQAGVVVASSTLTTGQRNGDECVYVFAVDNVPKASFYSVEVSHRGQLHYSYDQMQSSDWTVAMTLGQ
jgi:2',3'-cyclic-nucleotide 2'-phosphodiesterase (5'-nucleotidase family)